MALSLYYCNSTLPTFCITCYCPILGQCINDGLGKLAVQPLELYPYPTEEHLLFFRWVLIEDLVEHLSSLGPIEIALELLVKCVCSGNCYTGMTVMYCATKWFGTFKKKCGLDDRLLVFHSFRHTLTDNLKQQLINETLIDELTGHALQGETMGRYGKRYSVRVLYDEAVLKLDYGVDLGHLRGSKWVMPGL